ncbi:hypothetical protein M3649_03195 [Ureibacillus chungkukjangi]|uniref:hypothetical protein n=1 Tax=Ureibacillus chungkukjangi TaxID=1202712 RepID=UPI0020410C2C|nr:hypothetical protein [Ureibacillus chungkukjangi]MCM3387137.1 hypothetical protein [Ureibacillus chungkukjangi]
MKKMMILILAIILSGCNKITPANTYEQPQGKVVMNDNEYPMLVSKFEWVEEDFEIRKLDSPDINELAEEFETIEVDKKDSMTIEIDQNPTSIIVDQWNEEGEFEAIEMNGNEIPIPAEAGTYIYEVTAGWAEGKLTYIFDITTK